MTTTTKGKKIVADGRKALDTVSSDLYGDMPESAMLTSLEELGPLLERIAKKWNKLKKFQPLVNSI